MSFFSKFFGGLFSQQPLTKALPHHVGIIMDGNGRWANKRGLPRIFGHTKGVDSVRLIVKLAQETGLRYLTLYAFSYENWRRPDEEVSGLLGLIRKHLAQELDELHKNEVCVRIIGERDKLPKDIQKLIQTAEEKTAENTKLTLVIALSYSSRQEIISAAKKLIAQVEKEKMNLEDINEETFSQHLHTHGIPDPDLIIRTSGEKRLSNFLLWQSAYSELYFSPLHWPEFSREEFIRALDFYGSRQRRYGRV